MFQKSDNVFFCWPFFRASSVGRYDDREGLNPEVVPRFGSARSSPAPPMSRATLSKNQAQS
jgi:hypothetical protein